MATVRKQIADIVITRLGAAGKPTGLVVLREGVSPKVEESDLANGACLVELRDGEPRRVAGAGSPMLERDLFVKLRWRKIVSAGQALDVVLDALISWGIRQMMSDERFGGLATGTFEGTPEWTSGEGAQELAGVDWPFRVVYRTSAVNPETK